MSGGNISGNMETSMSFDVSAVAAGSQAVSQYLVTMQGSVDRTSASFQQSSAATESYVQSMERAAQIVELLSMRMLTMQSQAAKSGQTVRQFASDVNSAASSMGSAGQSLTQAMMGGSLSFANQQEMERLAEDRLRMQRAWVDDQARLLAIEKGNADQARQDELTSLRIDIERRSQIRRRWIQSQLAENAAAAGFSRIDQPLYAGNRRGGFAAQQFAYFAEDFAQVYGTMGLAGGLRAGANNLTAMASVMGPVAGSMASLAAAAGLLGLHLWEANKSLTEAKEKEEDWLSVRGRILSTFSEELSIQRQLNSIRTGSLSSLTSSLGAVQERADRQRQEAQVNQIDLLKSQLQARGGSVDSLDSGTWTSFFRGLWQGGASEASNQVMESYRQNVERLRLQQKISFLVTQEEMKIKDRTNEERISNEILSARTAILTRTNELLNAEKKTADEMVKLQADYLIAMQTRFVAEEAEAERTKVILDLAQRILDLRKEGEAAAKSAKDSLTGQFTALNAEFAFEQQILNTRKEITEEIKNAELAGTINAKQAKEAQDELRRVLILERERKQAQDDINRLQKEEEEVRKRLTVGPAGLTGAVLRGSEQAIQVLEQDRLRKLNNQENAPVVQELKGILAEIKAQKQLLEAIAKERPNIAVLEGF